MAVLLIEGFDSSQSSKNVLKGWTSTATPSFVAGRFGGFAVRCGNASQAPQKTIATSTTVIAGVAVRFDPTAVSGTTDFLQLFATATNAVRLGLDGTGRIRVRNSGATVIATGATVLTGNTWFYLEVKAVIAGASGSVELRLNGVTEIATTTGNFGSASLTAFQVLGGSAASQDFDDVYVLDATGSAPRNTFLGDVRVATLFPTADGANSAWTPDTGSPHFSRVNEAATTYPDDDTSYVSDSTPGHTDTYVFGDLPAGATAVYGVQVNMYARKDDAGTRTIAPVIRQSGTDSAGTTQSVPSSYAYLSQIYQQDPAAADWTVANVNADEFGVREIA